MLILYVHQTVLHELHLCDTFCESLYFFLLNVDLVFLHQLIFSELPFQFVQHFREVLIEFLLGHLLVGSQYPAFQEVLRECYFLHLLHDSLFGINTEAIFALLSQAANDILFDALAESLLILRSLSAVHLSEQLSIYCAGFYFCFRALLFVFRDILAKAVGVCLNLLVDHFLGRLDRVLRQFVLAIEFSVELRSYGDVECEGEGVLVIKVDVLRQLIIRQRLT